MQIDIKISRFVNNLFWFIFPVRPVCHNRPEQRLCGSREADLFPAGSDPPQVWPLTQLFSVSLLWKLIDLPGMHLNDPSSGKHYSLPFLPATPSSPSRALLPELQRYKDTVRCAVLDAEVPGHRKEQLKQTLIVRLLKTHFFTHWSLIIKSQQNKIELVTRHGFTSETAAVWWAV